MRVPLCVRSVFFHHAQVQRELFPDVELQEWQVAVDVSDLVQLLPVQLVANARFGRNTRHDP
jgi:hypothetical protein